MSTRILQAKETEALRAIGDGMSPEETIGKEESIRGT